jgi:dTDP-4-amino-4,6-dideoxygalactose transaminase
VTTYARSSRFRFIAPAGAPIPVSAILSAVAGFAAGGRSASALESAIASLVGVRACSVFSTGRAGLTVLLRTLRQRSSDRRDEVIIPSYTCYSVAGSVVKAGLVPRVADIDPATLDFDYDRLARVDFRRTLAVVATNLYGLPSDLPRLTAIARARGAAVVDDAAQALGATRDGRPCGTFGDAGLYSFDKGKNISAIDGGAVVTNDARIADAVAREAADAPAASTSATAQVLIKLSAYALLLHPRLYWIPNGLPLLGLGRTVYTTEYPIGRHPQCLSALALAMLPRLPQYTTRRRGNAETMLARVRGAAGLQTIEPAPGVRPAYLRLPLLLENREARDRALQRLNRAGIGATGSYPSSIADVPALRGVLRGDDRDACGGREVAARILTLPTHPFVSIADARRAADLLVDAAQGDTDGCRVDRSAVEVVAR